jgi:hypothetical protein
MACPGVAAAARSRSVMMTSAGAVLSWVTVVFANTMITNGPHPSYMDPRSPEDHLNPSTRTPQPTTQQPCQHGAQGRLAPLSADEQPSPFLSIKMPRRASAAALPAEKLPRRPGQALPPPAAADKRIGARAAATRRAPKVGLHLDSANRGGEIGLGHGTATRVSQAPVGPAPAVGSTADSGPEEPGHLSDGSGSSPDQ